jgi:hypothetical protein
MFNISLIAALILCCCIVPVSAVVLEVTCKGQVTTANAEKNTITIKNPEQYGCNYPATGGPVCSWKPVSGLSSVSGTVPDSAAFSVFSGGELAIATSLGGLSDTGGQWITLAKIYGPKDTEQLVTDVVGDPGSVPLPLIGDYSVTTETVPDCNSCTGTTCTATQAKVTLKSSGSTVLEKTLAPGESCTYNGRNDGSGVMVKFVSGQAASQSCPGKAGMTGPQALSVFIVKVTPPVGYNQVDIRTATTTRPDEALPFPSSQVTTVIPIPAQTRSGMFFPVAAVGALAGVVLILIRR